MSLKAEFKVKEEDIDELNYKLSRLANAEEVANKALKKGASIMYKYILDLTPAYVGDRKHKAHAKHARNSQPYKTTYQNLGFSLSTKKAYNYLYFPDQGEGTSKHNDPQEFFATGADDAYKDIIEALRNAFDEALQK